MNDVLYLLLTLVAFALLAVLVGALDRFLDDPAHRGDPADPAAPSDQGGAA